MKLRKVAVNARKKQLELTVRSGEVFPLPFSRMDPRPTTRDPIVDARVDEELAREGASFRLSSGLEGVVLVDQALDYNSDPVYVTEMLVHRLTVEAGARLKKAGLSIREVARLLRTSVPQVYRLLDPANSRKSLAQLVSLLQALDCDVEVLVKPRNRRSGAEVGGVAGKTITKPATKTMSKPASKSDGKSIAKPVTKSVSKRVCRPASKAA